MKLNVKWQGVYEVWERSCVTGLRCDVRSDDVRRHERVKSNVTSWKRSVASWGFMCAGFEVWSDSVYWEKEILHPMWERGTDFSRERELIFERNGIKVAFFMGKSLAINHAKFCVNEFGFSNGRAILQIFMLGCWLVSLKQYNVEHFWNNSFL